MPSHIMNLLNYINRQMPLDKQQLLQFFIQKWAELSGRTPEAIADFVIDVYQGYDIVVLAQMAQQNLAEQDFLLNFAEGNELFYPPANYAYTLDGNKARPFRSYEYYKNLLTIAERNVIFDSAIDEP